MSLRICKFLFYYLIYLIFQKKLTRWATYGLILMGPAGLQLPHSSVFTTLHPSNENGFAWKLSGFGPIGIVPSDYICFKNHIIQYVYINRNLKQNIFYYLMLSKRNPNYLKEKKKEKKKSFLAHVLSKDTSSEQHNPQLIANLSEQDEVGLISE